jgi:hypothetical protein
MFDAYTLSLIESLPELPGLDRASCRRALAAGYFYVVSQRVAMRPVKGRVSNRHDTYALLRRMVDALESAAVFDPLDGIQYPQRELQSAAFVAAEALAARGGTPSPTHAADNSGFL